MPIQERKNARSERSFNLRALGKDNGIVPERKARPLETTHKTRSGTINRDGDYTSNGPESKSGPEDEPRKRHHRSTKR